MQTRRDAVAGATPELLVGADGSARLGADLGAKLGADLDTDLDTDLVGVLRVAPDAVIARAVAGARSALWRGAHAVLATLNSRTRFRYTGLYRVEPPVLRNVALFDRENPMQRAAGEGLLLRDTYCNIVAANALGIAIADAPNDVRLIGHPARESVRSYVGVPVRDRAGRVAGTLCHWDSRPRLAPAGELLVLERVAALLVPMIGSATPAGAGDRPSQ